MQRDWLDLVVAVACALMFSAGDQSRSEESQDPSDATGAASPACLSPYNLSVPFSYVPGGQRRWPITVNPFPVGTRVTLTARDGQQTLATGEHLQCGGLTVSITPIGGLQISADEGATARLELEIAAKFPTGARESQTLELRPAPPNRPISYYADFGDDLIRIFMDATGKFRPVSKGALDQYFRRVQAHGTPRLIVWLSPFPFIADSANYPVANWQRYEQQARAILDDATLTQALDARSGFTTWGWLRYLMATRLNPEFGRLVGQSAADHGIRLTVCYRPFEAALTKYYEVPVFDQDGQYLWGFLPLAAPTTNYQPESVGCRHYRSILHEIGHGDAAQLETIEFPGVTDAARFAGQSDLRIEATRYPPLADDSLVLVRQTTGSFALRRFESIRDAAAEHHQVLPGVRLSCGANGLTATGLEMPKDARYLLVSWTGPCDGPDLDVHAPVVLRARAGNRLGRETTYWVQGEPTGLSRVAGITANGEYRAEFQASESSQRAMAAGPERVTLAGRLLVIDLGDNATVEMLDFNQPLARQNAIREIATVLRQPGFDEILLNTRSHVDLAFSMADGELGIQPAGRYWRQQRGLRTHLGLDKAYLPRSTASLELVRQLAQQPEGVERLTTWQPEEWSGVCQLPGDLDWRQARNQGIVDGLRALLEDLERAFPGRRIRMVVPPSPSAVEQIMDQLDVLARPDGSPYGRGFYNQLWPTGNYIPCVGEGAAMVSLRGLSVEPVLLGSGGSRLEMPLFERYVRECVADLAGNRGSRFRGARSYFFEAQSTLRAEDRVAARQMREEMICHLLSQPEEINEVILYESADWLYFLPLADPDLCGHGFLDRCGAQPR